jgi:hypothetical protein
LTRLGLNDINYGMCSDLRVIIEEFILVIEKKIV